MIVLFALLPLQWFGLGSTPLGTGRLHQVALVGFAAVVLSCYRLRAHAPVLRTAALFVVMSLYWLLAWAAVDLYNGRLPRGSVQELIYLAVFVALSTCFFRGASAEEPRLATALRWVAPVACASVVIGFSVAMLVNGVNPAAVLGRTIASADPELFQKEVFKTSFAGFGLDEEMVKGNLRHEIFGSLLLSMMISTWAMRFGPSVTTRAQHVAYRMAMITGVVLLTLSLSRSVLIAALVWPALALSRSVRRGGLTSGQVAGLAGTIVAAAGLAFSGVGLVIWNRFTTDTTGYDARAENYFAAFEALPDHWLTGGFETGGVSSHNFVVDSMLRGGIFTALPALAMLVIVVALFVRLVISLPQQPEWLVPVAAALALPLVRMGTSGGGLIPPIEWVALAFAMGIVTHVRTQVAGRETAPVLTEARR